MYKYELQFEVIFTTITERAEKERTLSCSSYNCYPDVVDWRNILNQIFLIVEKNNVNFILARFVKAYEI